MITEKRSQDKKWLVFPTKNFAVEGLNMFYQQIRMSGFCERLVSEVRANRSKWYDLNDTEAVDSFDYFA